MELNIIELIMPAVGLSFPPFFGYILYNLGKEKECKLLAERYATERTIYEIFHEKLETYINKIEKFFKFSEKLLSPHSFYICTFIALVYPVILFILGDILFNKGFLLNFENKYDLIERVGIILVIIFPYLIGFLSLFLFFLHIFKYQGYLRKIKSQILIEILVGIYSTIPLMFFFGGYIWISLNIGELFSLDENSYETAINVILGSFFITFLYIYHLVFDKNYHFSINRIALVLLLGVIILPLIFNWLLNAWLSLLENLTNSSFQKSERGILQASFMFGLVFPIINGLMDSLSIAFTRKFIKSWLNKKNDNTHKDYNIFVSYIKYSLLDIFVAFLALFILAFILCFLSVISSKLFAGDFDWLSQWKYFALSPFSDGLMISLMLFSTLIPSILHLSTGASLVPFKIISWSRTYIVSKLESPLDMELRIWLALLISIYRLAPFVIISVLIFGIYTFLPLGFGTLHDLVVAVGYGGIQLAEWLVY